jgi:hypothetical protein
VNSNYIIELKYRILLILSNLVFITNTSYLYKHILLFILVKYLIYNESVNFYLISTNILELLNLYFNIIYTITSNTVVYFLIYNCIMFLNYALYKREYELIKFALYVWLIINIGITLLIFITLFPLIWEFLKYYQRSFTINLIYFETKVNEYYTLCINIYLLTKYYLLIIIVITLIFKTYFKQPLLIRLRKLNIFITVSLSTIMNDLLIQSVLCTFLIACYELLLLYINYKQYYTDKIGFEPIILKI